MIARWRSRVCRGFAVDASGVQAADANSAITPSARGEDATIGGNVGFELRECVDRATLPTDPVWQ